MTGLACRPRRVLALSLLLLCAAGSAAASPPSGRAARVQVSAPVLVTGRTPLAPACSADAPEYLGAETEVSLAVSPRDEDVLVATWMQDVNGAHPIARSTDRGRTWQTVLVPSQTACTGNDEVGFVFDPWISYGGDGLLYLSSIGTGERTPGGNAVGRRDPFSAHVYVQVSADDGLTWSAPVIAGGDSDNGFLVDKATLTADPQRPGHAYATWTRIQLSGTPALGFSRTVDGGRTWQERELPLTAVDAGGSLGGLALSEVEVLANGDLLLVTGDVLPQPAVVPTGLLSNLTGVPQPVDPFVGPMRYRALRSTDAGLTWTSAGPLGEGRSVPEPPATAVAPDGTVYVGWIDRGPSSSHLVVMRSGDGARTWSPTARVVTDRHVSVAALAADGTGTVAASFYEQAGTRVHQRVLVSQDRGRTWLEAPLAPPFDVAAAPETNAAGGSVLGDYEGLVGQERGFTSVSAVAGRLARHGPTDLVSQRAVLVPARR